MKHLLLSREEFQIIGQCISNEVIYKFEYLKGKAFVSNRSHSRWLSLLYKSTLQDEFYKNNVDERVRRFVEIQLFNLRWNKKIMSYDEYIFEFYKNLNISRVKNYSIFDEIGNFYGGDYEANN